MSRVARKMSIPSLTPTATASPVFYRCYGSGLVCIYVESDTSHRHLSFCHQRLTKTSAVCPCLHWRHWRANDYERTTATSDWPKPKIKCIISDAFVFYDNEPKPGGVGVTEKSRTRKMQDLENDRPNRRVENTRSNHFACSYISIISCIQQLSHAKQSVVMPKSTKEKWTIKMIILTRQ